MAMLTAMLMLVMSSLVTTGLSLMLLVASPSCAQSVTYYDPSTSSTQNTVNVPSQTTTTTSSGTGLFSRFRRNWNNNNNNNNNNNGGGSNSVVTVESSNDNNNFFSSLRSSVTDFAKQSMEVQPLNETVTDKTRASTVCPTLIATLAKPDGFYATVVKTEIDARRNYLLQNNAQLPNDQDKIYDPTTATVGHLKAITPHIFASLRSEIQKQEEEGDSTSNAMTTLQIPPHVTLAMTLKNCERKLKANNALTEASLERVTSETFLWAMVDLARTVPGTAGVAANLVVGGRDVTEISKIVTECMRSTNAIDQLDDIIAEDATYSTAPGMIPRTQEYVVENEIFTQFLTKYSNALIGGLDGDDNAISSSLNALEKLQEDIEDCARGEAQQITRVLFDEEITSATNLVQQKLEEYKTSITDARAQTAELTDNQNAQLDSRFATALGALEKAKERVKNWNPNSAQKNRLDRSSVLPRPSSDQRAYRNRIRRCMGNQIGKISGLENVRLWELRCELDKFDSMDSQVASQIRQAMAICAEQTQPAPQGMPEADEADEIIPMLHMLSGDRYPCENLLAARESEEAQVASADAPSCGVPASVLLRQVITRQSEADQIQLVYLLHDRQSRRELAMYAMSLEQARNNGVSCDEKRSEIKNKLVEIKSRQEARIREEQKMEEKMEEEKQKMNDAETPPRADGSVLITKPSSTETTVIKPFTSSSTGPMQKFAKVPGEVGTGLLFNPQDFVKSHNDKRCLHGSQKLDWDANLASQSQVYANKCEWKHSGMDGVGENLSMFASTSESNLLSDNPATRAMQGWYDKELPLYDFSSPGFSMATGHFTQVVWASTTKVGCGVALCPAGTIASNMQSVYVVCQYGPPGNYQSKFNENVLGVSRSPSMCM